MKVKNTLVKLSLGLAVICSLPVSAANIKATSIINEVIYGSTVGFTSKGTVENSLITISGPDGYFARKFSKVGIPTIDLHSFGHLKDGLYLYEITTSAGKLVLIKDTINNGRGENDSHYARKGVTLTGHFRMINGQVKKYKKIKEPAISSGF